MQRAFRRFDVTIQPKQGDTYPCSMRGPGVDTRGTLRIPANDAEFQEWLRRLDSGDRSDDLLARAGQWLFTTLFRGQFRDALQRARNTIRSDEALRMALVIAPEEIAALPWELIADPELGPLIQQLPIIRAVPKAANDLPPPNPLPLRVLLSAAPCGSELIQRRFTETAALLRTLGHQIRVIQEPHLTIDALQRHLRDGIDVWHVIGRAQPGSGAQPPQLVFENASGRPEPAAGARIEALLHASRLRTGFLELYESPTLAPGVLQGLVRSFTQSQVPAVLATVVSQPDRSTDALTEAWYMGMVGGLMIDAAAAAALRAAFETPGYTHPGRVAFYGYAPDLRLVTSPQPDLGGEIVASGTQLPGAAQAILVQVHSAGTLLNAGRLPVPRRSTQALPPPVALRQFAGREAELRQLAAAMAPGSMLRIESEDGAGLTALLRQAAATESSRRLPDGVVLVDGDATPAHLDDMLHMVFERFYTSDPPLRMSTDLARAYLQPLQALWVFDHVPPGKINADRLEAILGGRSALWIDAAPPTPTVPDGETPPEPPPTLMLAGLPRDEALRLLTGEARMRRIDPDETEALQKVCELLHDLPQPLLIVGRMVRLQLASIGRIVKLIDDMPGETGALARVVRLVLRDLSADERAVLAAMVRSGPPMLDADMIAAVCQRPLQAVETALRRLADLRLVEPAEDRHMIAGHSLRNLLDSILPDGVERVRAASYYAEMVLHHHDEPEWLMRELPGIVQAIRTLQADDKPGPAVALARIIHPLLVTRGRWQTWNDVLASILQIAQSGGDRVLQAWALHERGTRAALLGDHEAATADLDQALRMRVDFADKIGAEVSRHNLAFLGVLEQLAERNAANPTAAAQQDQAPEARVSPRVWAVGITLLVLIVAGLMILGRVASIGPEPAATPTVPAATASIQPAGVVPTSAAPPAPTATPTLAPTTAAVVIPATATLTPLPELRCVVAVDGLNLRNGPGTEYGPRLRVLRRGTQIIVRERNPSGDWARGQVDNADDSGWFLAAATECSGDLSILPVGSIPPTPTAAPRPPRPTATPLPTETPAPTLETPVLPPLPEATSEAPPEPTATPVP